MRYPTPLEATSASRDLVARRHPEWAEHQLRWRWLLDSLEGGERYRQAIYGFDRRGMPVRNLIRHKREYPAPSELAAQAALGYASAPFGADPATIATDDDYELRRARTPVPTFVAEKIGDHLDRVYALEVEREGPEGLTAWWADVDGTGKRVDRWMRDLVAPTLLACGSLDILLDHPPAPEGAVILSRADAARLGIQGCIASIILPENMVWWRLGPRGRYVECLVRECAELDVMPSRTAMAAAPALRDPSHYRHWTPNESALYDAEGRELDRAAHPFGIVPIVRVVTRPKARCRNVGQSSYEGTAERQREYYNRDSELILSDTTQAHPLIQGPEDFMQADGAIPIGPSWLLPKKKDEQHGTYEGFDIIEFPKEGAASLRLNKQDLRDEIDRDAGTAKPAGMGGTGAGVVSQSGLSKGYDNIVLNNKLAAIAELLATVEMTLAEYVTVVLADGRPGVMTGVERNYSIEYSHQFDLTEVEDLGAFLNAILGIVEAPAASLIPTISEAFMGVMLRQALPGREDEVYDAWDAEFAAALARAGAQSEALAEATLAAAQGADAGLGQGQGQGQPAGGQGEGGMP
jgi:hypothetical protein